MVSPCQLKIISSLIDSSIDFHAINPRLAGKEYHHFWVVSHTRKRDDQGGVTSAVSTLSKITIPGNDLSFNASSTVTNSRCSCNWNKCDYCYLRNPVFVPNQNPKGEDDGHIFVWSYQFSNNDDNESPANPTHLLIFQASGLQTMATISLPSMFRLPYPIHSSCYVLPEDNSVPSKPVATLVPPTIPEEESPAVQPPTIEGPPAVQPPTTEGPPAVQPPTTEEPVVVQPPTTEEPVVVNDPVVVADSPLHILQDAVEASSTAAIEVSSTGNGSSINAWSQLSVGINVDVKSSTDQVETASSSLLSRLLAKIRRKKEQISEDLDELAEEIN